MGTVHALNQVAYDVTSSGVQKAFATPTPPGRDQTAEERAYDNMVVAQAAMHAALDKYNASYKAALAKIDQLKAKLDELHESHKDLDSHAGTVAVDHDAIFDGANAEAPVDNTGSATKHIDNLRSDVKRADKAVGDIRKQTLATIDQMKADLKVARTAIQTSVTAVQKHKTEWEKVHGNLGKHRPRAMASLGELHL